MSVKIRLARHGAKKAPFYRVVAADSRAPRDGRFIEVLGRYNPRTNPSTIELDLAKVDSWIAKGAQPTEAAASLIAIARGEKTLPESKDRMSKKAVAREKAAIEEAAAAVKAAEEAAVNAAEEAAAAKVAAEEAAAEAPVEDAAEAEAPESTDAE